MGALLDCYSENSEPVVAAPRHPSGAPETSTARSGALGRDPLLWRITPASSSRLPAQVRHRLEPGGAFFFIG